MIWNRERECMPREAMEQLQLDRLKNVVSRVWERVPFYREKMSSAGVRPDDIRTLSDLRKLPFTHKDDLRATYPFGLFAVPLKDVSRIHASSGTTGKQIVVGYTASDLDTWSELCARFITAAGVRSDDVVQIAFGYGLFTGGFGLHYGMERVGATVIPASAGNTERHLTLMRDFGTTTLVCTPSYALHLGEAAEEAGVRNELSLRWGLFGGEPWTREMGHEIERKLGLSATDNYGLSEVMGPGVSGECEERKNGLHISEDHFLVEVIDPDTFEPLTEDEEGELVITTLTKEALPILRYRTRDLSRVTTRPCECGRTTARMEKVAGRTDDMLIIRGVNVFPSQIESVLLEMEEIEPHYELTLTKEGVLDAMEVKVEVSASSFTGNLAELKRLEEKVHRRIQTVLGISVRLRLVEPKTLARSEGKAQRVIDLR